MGRGKIEIKRIENQNNRQVTYSKRRAGILKKAKEISVLCNAKVSLVMFASNGKMTEFCSPSSSVPEILEKYHKNAGLKLWDAKHENLNSEIDRIKKENDNMQIELRHLKGEDITSLPYPELMRLELALQNGIDSIRQRQMDMYTTHKKNTRMLEEEQNQLTYMLHKQEMEGGVVQGGMCNNLPERDCHYQMPFGFRVQPMQPNLQERM